PLPSAYRKRLGGGAPWPRSAPPPPPPPRNTRTARAVTSKAATAAVHHVAGFRAARLRRHWPDAVDGGDSVAVLVRPPGRSPDGRSPVTVVRSPSGRSGSTCCPLGAPTPAASRAAAI